VEFKAAGRFAATYSPPAMPVMPKRCKGANSVMRRATTNGMPSNRNASWSDYPMPPLR